MSEAPSVRESLQAALESADTPEVPAASVAPAAEVGTEIVEPVAAAEVPPAGPARDATGKFAPKVQDTPAEAGAETPATPTAEPTEPETAKPADKEPQTEAIPIPPSLSAAVKAQWAELPVEVRKEFGKLEGTVQNAKAEWGKKGERLNRYEEIVGPRRERWNLSGLDEFSGIQALLAAQDYLERDPVGGLNHIARSYGVDLRNLAGQATQQRPGAEGQPAPTAIPELQSALQPLVQQVQTLEQKLQQSEQLIEQQKQSEAQATVDAFSAKPENIYFENVRPVVAMLIGQGLATTLEDAYQQAIWASPEIRPLLVAEQAKASAAASQAKAQEQAARSKAQSAQRSAGSITGAPAPGAQAPAGPVGSIRDTLKAAAQEVGWQV